jgi:hypothetical protein
MGCCYFDGCCMVVMLNVVWLFCDLKEVGFVQDVDDDWRR